MRSYQILASLVLLCSALSCIKPNKAASPDVPAIPSSTMKITALTDAQSLFDWNIGDEMVLIYPDGNASPDVVRLGNIGVEVTDSTIFLGYAEPRPVPELVYGVYPAQSYYARDAESDKLQFGVSQLQKTVENGTAWNVSTSAFHIEDAKCRFDTHCGFVSITANAGEGIIKSVRIKAEGKSLAGTLECEYGNDCRIASTSIVNSSDSLILKGLIENDIKYYAAVLPVEIEKLSLLFTNNVGKTVSIEETVNKKIERNGVLDLGPYTIDFEKEPEPPITKLVFNQEWVDKWKEAAPSDWSSDNYYGTGYSDGHGISYSTSGKAGDGMTCKTYMIAQNRMLKTGGSIIFTVPFEGDVKISLVGYGSTTSAATSVYYNVNNSAWNRPWVGVSGDPTRWQLIGYKSATEPVSTLLYHTVTVKEGDQIAVSAASNSGHFVEISVEKLED